MFGMKASILDIHSFILDNQILELACIKQLYPFVPKTSSNLDWAQTKPDWKIQYFLFGLGWAKE